MVAMALKSELERQGAWLFRWRSYLPLACTPVAVAVVANMHWPFGSFRFHEIWESGCLAVSFAGLAIRAITVGHAPAGTSGRNTRRQLASTLNTTGVYSIVRHPLYVGNYVIGLGAVLVPFVWWLPLLYTAAFWLYYERIMLAEEAFLQRKFGDDFERWASATPAFIPRPSQWRSAREPFVLRSVLRREYTGLAVVTLLHGGIEVAEHFVIEHRVVLNLPWAAMIAGGLSGYVLLRSLKKHTQLLDAPGR
jgi:protein-S-isoprenylcysteine O-methyltransferase Ste14